MDQVLVYWKYIVIAVIGLLGLGAGVLVTRRKTKQVAATAKATEAEKLLVPSIKAARTKLGELSKDAVKNKNEIAKVEAEIAENEEKLHADYKASGYSAEEVADRFRRIKL